MAAGNADVASHTEEDHVRLGRPQVAPTVRGSVAEELFAFSIESMVSSPRSPRTSTSG